jgi:hypothetical protein
VRLPSLGHSGYMAKTRLWVHAIGKNVPFTTDSIVLPCHAYFLQKIINTTWDTINPVMQSK